MKKTLALLSLLVAINSGAFDLNSALNTAKDVVSSTNSSDYKSIVAKALEASVNELSKNGFLNTAIAKIELPPALKTAANLAKSVGGEKYANELTANINEAATKAVGGASAVIANVVKNMREDELKSLFSSSDNALTEYMQKNAGEKLNAVFRPIIAEMMSKNSFANAYNTLNSYIKDSALLKGETANSIKNLAANFGLKDTLPNSDEDLNGYISRKSLDGLFALMGQKESELKSGAVGKGFELLNKLK